MSQLRRLVSSSRVSSRAGLSCQLPSARIRAEENRKRATRFFSVVVTSFNYDHFEMLQNTQSDYDRPESSRYCAQRSSF